MDDLAFFRRSGRPSAGGRVAAVDGWADPGRSGPRPRDVRAAQPGWGREEAVGGTKVSLIDRGLDQRARFWAEPALSLVPEARPPPKGCCPTTEPVGLSLM